MVNASSFLRKCIGFFLFVVFAFSITPVNLLHDVVANHKDVCYHDFHNDNKQISKADINCHCIDFVAEAQFINGYKPFVFTQLIQSTPPIYIPFEQDFYSQHHIYRELRGPPCLM